MQGLEQRRAAPLGLVTRRRMGAERIHQGWSRRSGREKAAGERWGARKVGTSFSSKGAERSTGRVDVQAEPVTVHVNDGEQAIIGTILDCTLPSEE